MSSPYFGALPSECLFDETLDIRLHGLSPGSQVKLWLASAGPADTVLVSHATFVTFAGDIDLARDAPVSGSYTGVDPMGLFWSRTSVPMNQVESHLYVALDPMTVTLTAEIQPGPLRLTHGIRTRYYNEKVSCREIRENGMVGKLFEPAAPGGAYPTVLVVGGSGGGFQWCGEMAALLASHGFVSLALAYFGRETLPPTLDRIPLEYFGQALHWLSSQPKVDPGRIAVSGASRGGELALLLGATYPAIKAVIAYVPSGIVRPANPPTGHSAWTWKGQEVPHAAVLPLDAWNLLIAEGRAQPGSFERYFIPLQDKAYADRATIPVEKINGPVLLISGRDDRVWPSADLAEFAVRRFHEKGFAHLVEHLSYAGAGHSIGWPNVSTMMTKSKHPVSGEDQDLGGSPAKTAYARADSWVRMLAFLRRNL